MTRLYGAKGWTAIGASALVLFVVFPLLSLAVPQGNPLHLSQYWVTLIGKIMCYAIVAIAMDLIWGYCGILSLGHGLFFALGGYGMGMYLMRQIGREGQYQSDLPDFMVFLDWKALPWQWWNSDQFWWAMLLVVAVPGLLAFVFGYFAFRSRVKGVYFSIITQALTFAAMLLFFRNNTGFGGNNGFTDFKRILGFAITTPETRMALFAITGAALIGTLLLARWIVTSKLGRVLTAIRDAETRVAFCGYDTVHYKVAIFTLSAVLCGIAGALYVPQVGIINPSEMSPANSIEIAIWVALGGRGTLVGPIIGAGLVNGAKSYFTQAYPEYWLFFLGLIFILATLFLPKGIAGLAQQWRARVSAATQQSRQPAAVQQARGAAAQPAGGTASSRGRAPRAASAAQREAPGLGAERGRA
jgi:urea transport system permease protein